MSQNNKKIFYEDSICKISFNFWSEEGDVSFTFSNKTETDIKINLEETFFIINGYAISYFGNRIFQLAKSESSKESEILKNVNFESKNILDYYAFYNEITNLKTFSVGMQYNEPNKLIIPPKSFRKIKEPSLFIVPKYYQSTLLNPTPQKPHPVDFTDINSPFKFRIRICFELDGQRKTYFDKSFYVSQILNVRESNFYKVDYEYIEGTLNENVSDINGESNFFKLIMSIEKDLSEKKQHFTIMLPIGFI